MTEPSSPKKGIGSGREAQRSKSARPPTSEPVKPDYYEGFARAVRDGTEPPATAEQGIAVLAVLDAARESATSGRSVDVAPA